MHIGKAIKTVRKQIGLTQGDLSSKTGISQTSISKIETGVRPSEDNLQKIADVLQVPVAVLYVLAIDEMDVPEKKREKFQVLLPAIRSLALQIVETPE